MPNRLAHENSPYLLQHQGNPVDWYPWGEEALQKARAEDKPIFLSIGYAACHWCHVMEHESFEDPDIAALMNAHFINIKVDREERPDLDNIYMNAVVAMTGQGGWPMSVFLTPDGKPFFGGTYFPPTRRHSMPSFREVLLSVAEAWKNDRARLDESGEQIAAHLAASLSIGEQEAALDPASLDHAGMALAQHYDWQHGGWGGAPKFPQPMVIRFLLTRAQYGDQMALDIATHALRAMARGGMYDVVGGGFHRYSVDDLWLVPHFEKMLYDNAQLAQAYLQAFMVTGDRDLRRVCEATIDFVLREMTGAEGGFYSSLDADSPGGEGFFYTWTMEEVAATLPEKALLELVHVTYNLSEAGNFEGRNLLQKQWDDRALAERLALPPADIPGLLARAHQRLLETRNRRPRPATDDKVLTAWNGLMLQSLAEAARYLKRPDYLEAARCNARFLLTQLDQDGHLLRSWRAGTARHNGYLEDYGALILGLLALYQSDPDPHWYTRARKLAEAMVDMFSDPEGGFFDTRHDHESLLVRPKDVQDNATPSGNALAVSALLRLAAYEGNESWRQQAEQALRSAQRLAARYPTGFGQWLNAFDFAFGPVDEIAILGDPAASDMQALIEVVWRRYRPRAVAAIAEDPPPPGSPALLRDRYLVNGAPTAYVCRNFTCQAPVITPQELQVQLGNT